MFPDNTKWLFQHKKNGNERKPPITTYVLKQHWCTSHSQEKPQMLFVMTFSLYCQIHMLIKWQCTGNAVGFGRCLDVAVNAQNGGWKGFQCFHSTLWHLQYLLFSYCISVLTCTDSEYVLLYQRHGEHDISYGYNLQQVLSTKENSSTYSKIGEKTHQFTFETQSSNVSRDSIFGFLSVVSKKQYPGNHNPNCVCIRIIKITVLVMKKEMCCQGHPFFSYN